MEIILLSENPLFINFLLFLFIPFGILFILSVFVIYHLKNYGIEGDLTKKSTVVFSCGIILIFIFAVITFLYVDWDNMSLKDFNEKSEIILYEYE